MHWRVSAIGATLDALPRPWIQDVQWSGAGMNPTITAIDFRCDSVDLVQTCLVLVALLRGYTSVGCEFESMSAVASTP